MADPVRIQQRRTAGWRKPTGALSVAAPTPWQNPWRPDPVAFYRWAHNMNQDALGPARHPRCLRARPRASYMAQPMSLRRPTPDHHRPPTPHELKQAAREALVGHDLMCWCGLHRACHADVWLELVNDLPDQPWLVTAEGLYILVETPTITSALIRAYLRVNRPDVPLDRFAARVATEAEAQNLRWAGRLTAATAAERKDYLVREKR